MTLGRVVDEQERAQAVYGRGLVRTVQEKLIEFHRAMNVPILPSPRVPANERVKPEGWTPPDIVRVLAGAVEVTHTCHARECGQAVKPELLMCARHWRLVPKHIQRAAWKHYRPGQCDDKNVSPQWLEAADAAIGYVAKLENRGGSVAEVRALKAFGVVS